MKITHATEETAYQIAKFDTTRKAIRMFVRWLNWGESIALAIEAASDFLDTVAHLDDFTSSIGPIVAQYSQREV